VDIVAGSPVVVRCGVRFLSRIGVGVVPWMDNVSL